MAIDLNDKLLEAGVIGQRDSWNNVMPRIPPSGIRLTDLAARASMTKQAMAELVAEIERRGYLQRTTDPADRRAKIITFTDQGWATVNLALSALAGLEAEIAGRLGEPAVGQLRSTLLQILDRPAYTRPGAASGPC
jgi:DNA-binding MarR family transcriptional regulator